MLSYFMILWQISPLFAILRKVVCILISWTSKKADTIKERQFSLMQISNSRLSKSQIWTKTECKDRELKVLWTLNLVNLAVVKLYLNLQLNQALRRELLIISKEQHRHLLTFRWLKACLTKILKCFYLIQKTKSMILRVRIKVFLED